MPLKLSAQNEQCRHPSSYSGGNMKSYTTSWLLFSKSSANVSLPLGPSKTYCLSTFSHGSARRCRLSSSRSRVNSFSLASNAVRTESHSSRETTRWSLRLLLPLFVIYSPLLAMCAIVVGDNHERS